LSGSPAEGRSPLGCSMNQSSSPISKAARLKPVADAKQALVAVASVGDDLWQRLCLLYPSRDPFPVGHAADQAFLYVHLQQFLE
jgi:hypothetical protein